MKYQISKHTKKTFDTSDQASHRTRCVYIMFSVSNLLIFLVANDENMEHSAPVTSMAFCNGKPFLKKRIMFCSVSFNTLFMVMIGFPGLDHSAAQTRKQLVLFIMKGCKLSLEVGFHTHQLLLVDGHNVIHIHLPGLPLFVDK